jgi:hypothetical protein
LVRAINGLTLAVEVFPAMATTSDWSFTNTEHGLLVAFGEFLQQHGLLEQLMQVPLQQKQVTFAPQTKLVELLAGIMSGIEYLSDLNDSAHPLATDEIVAQAWGHPQFAHYSSVSRTLDRCDEQTVRAIQQAIVTFNRPFVHAAVQELARTGKPLVYDLDLTGQAVSATSTTYPDAAFGWMNDRVCLGYQLARICLTRHEQERIWLEGFHHPGDTVSAKCLQQLVTAAESQTHVRPRRRTQLVRQRLVAQRQRMQRPQRLLMQQQTKREHLRATDLRLRLQIAQAEPQLKRRRSKPKKAHLRQQIQGWRQRLLRLATQTAACERAIAHHQALLQQLTTEATALEEWWQQLENDNQTNPNAPVCLVRMDSGFCSGVNLTWLIEMGYQVETKAPNDQTTTALRHTLTNVTWTHVGANAEMIDGGGYTLHGCPYLVRVALERFHIGTTVRYATLLQYRDDGAPPSLASWFRTYNARQLIEAGNKELKSGVFHIQHLMTRSAAGIQIQVLFAGLAANTVRWALPWLQQCTVAPSSKWTQTLRRPKHIVRVAANTAALVQQTPHGTSLQFGAKSALAGTTLFLRGVPAFQLPLGLALPFQNRN